METMLSLLMLVFLFLHVSYFCLCCDAIFSPLMLWPAHLWFLVQFPLLLSHHMFFV